MGHIVANIIFLFVAFGHLYSKSFRDWNFTKKPGGDASSTDKL